MATPPKAPPRFVPTLTEVVQVPGAPQAATPVESQILLDGTLYLNEAD